MTVPGSCNNDTLEVNSLTRPVNTPVSKQVGICGFIFKLRRCHGISWILINTAIIVVELIYQEKPVVVVRNFKLVVIVFPGLLFITQLKISMFICFICI